MNNLPFVKKFNDKQMSIVKLNSQLESLNKKLDFLTSKEDDLTSTFAFIAESFSNLESKLERISHRQSDSQKTFVQNVLEKLDFLFFDNQIAKKQLMLEEDIRWCVGEINSLKISVTTTIEQINDAILRINEKIPKAPRQMLG